MSYDTRAFGDFGWTFVNAGERLRKMKNVSAEDKLMITGIFKQATMGDCLCEAPKETKRNELEIQQHQEWCKHKGMDTFEAMKLYVEKVSQLAELYPLEEVEEELQKGA